MSARPYRATACCLVALTGALGTGVPSHDHQDALRTESEALLTPADHHSHGTLLVEQDERAPSGAPEIMTASAADVEPPAPAVVSVAPVVSRSPRPTERAPPPGAPRAPPLPA